MKGIVKLYLGERCAAQRYYANIPHRHRIIAKWAEVYIDFSVGIIPKTSPDKSCYPKPVYLLTLERV